MRCSIILAGNNTGSAGSVITLNQATDTAGTSTKALAFSTYYACNGIIAGTPNDTFTTTAVVSNTYTTVATTTTRWVNIIEVRGTDLDVANSFNSISVTAGTQANCLLTILFLVRDINWPSIAPPTALS